MPAPIEIKPPRVGVNFNGNAMLGAGREHSLDVDFVPRPPQELPPGHMAQDGGVRIGDGAEDTLSLRLAIKLEASVDAGDDKVERVQHLGGKIERAVRKDVGLDAFKDAESAAVSLVEPVRLGLLLGNLLRAKAARVVRGLRMVGDAKILVAAAASVASAIVSSVSTPSERSVCA